MAAAELLLRRRAPNRAQVQEALGGVLCRCTGYLKIVDAVLLAGGEAAIEPLEPGDAEPVGQRLVRLDVAGKLDGQARYGADVCPEGALGLRVLRSPYPRAAFRFGDLDAWRRAHPQIVGFISAADIPNNRFSIFAELRDQPALADGEARFRGEAVLGIVGPDAALAAAMHDLPPVSFTELPAIANLAAATEAKDRAPHGFDRHTPGRGDDADGVCRTCLYRARRRLCHLA